MSSPEEFIKKAREVHGDRYDYSRVDYVDNKTKVCIICKEHGEFWQRPDVHFQRKGCPKCGRDRTAEFHSKSLEQFLHDAKRVHGNKYDYSKVEFVNYRTKVVIICPVHGDFTQSPSAHLQGQGCPKCGIDRTAMRMTNDDFINKAKAVHGDRYDYSKVQYVYNKTEVCIICREHGEFWQKPKNHLSGYGCPICSGRKKMRTIDYVKRAKNVHGDKYDYSKTEYKGNKEKVCIICPEHGEFWQQASNHLRGVGCPKCGFIASSSKQRIWTRERCYETARQYKELNSFIKECQAAYVIAHRNGWLQDYTWLRRRQLPNGYWSKELVMAEARRYTSSSMFREGNPSAYGAACRRGWIKECTWFTKPKNAKKWDYNTCFEEAQKYTSRQEFRMESVTAYTVARKHGWLDEYVWLEKLIFYSYDVCLTEARKYEYFNDFRSNSHRAYLVARSRGWLKKFDWLIKEPIEPYNKKWNYDTCFAEAKKYKTRSEFNNKRSRAYDVARRNGWLADYTWMPDITAVDSKVDSVYRYYFKEQNAVYVGRTLMYRQHIRDIDHRNTKNDTVYRYAQKNHLEIPPMQIIEDKLTVLQGREREDHWRKHYESQGCLILNKAATGVKSGSLGAIGRGKWTFEKAYQIAKCFHSAKEMNDEYG